MEWNALWGFVYGVLGGFFEFLPLPPRVHQMVFLQIAGLENPGYGLSLAVHTGALAAVIISCYGSLAKFRMEKKIQKRPRRNRTRQPDVVCLMEMRLLKIAAIPVILSCVLTPWISGYMERLWLLAILAVINGVVLFLPQYMTRANKDARSLSPLDATLIGLSGISGILPGVSRIGMMTSVSSMRGADGRFGLKFIYLLMIPALAALCVGDVGMLLFGGSAQASVPFWAFVTAFIAALGSGLAGIRLMRIFAANTTFGGLAYYSWGLAMFTFIIYLFR